MSEVKLTGLKDVVAWLECQPQWSGVAARRVDDPPIPGEPFISMDAAKHLVISAVSIMDNRSLEAAARIEALEGALKPLAEEVKAWTKMDDSYRPAAYSGAFSVGDLRRAARALETKPNPAKG